MDSRSRVKCWNLDCYKVQTPTMVPNVDPAMVPTVDSRHGYVGI